MNIKLLFTAVIILLHNFVNASIHWTKINSSLPEATEIKLIESKNDLKNTIIQFSLNAYNLKEVQTPRGISHIVEVPKGARILKAGAPDLPLYAKSVIIPELDEMEVHILSSKYIELYNSSSIKRKFTENSKPK